MQRYTVIYLWKLLYTFRVVSPPIIRSTHNCIYSIWHKVPYSEKKQYDQWAGCEPCGKKRYTQAEEE